MNAEPQSVQKLEKQSPPINAELQRAAINEAPVTDVPPIVHEVLQSPGQPLDAETRAFFEPRFGHDFSGVRVHTDAKAAESAQAVNARAYASRNDVIFGAKQYQPRTCEGKQLLAHELTHVVDQFYSTNPSIFRQPQSQPSKEWTMPMRTGYLGLEAWDFSSEPDINLAGMPSGADRFCLYVFAHSKEEWQRILSDIDSEDRYRFELQGFLELAIDPKKANRTKHPLGWRNYVNLINRPLTHEEIMEFIQALYTMGGDLNLRPFFLFAGPYMASLEHNLSEFINKYQGDIIAEISAKGQADGKKVLSQESIENLADQGGPGVRVVMVKQAIASAAEGTALLLKGHILSDEGQKSDAFAMIANAARVLRYTLNIHQKEMKFEEDLELIAVDAVLDGLLKSLGKNASTLLRRLSSAKNVFRKLGGKMLQKLYKGGNDPAFQAYLIAEEFEIHVRKFGPRSNETDTQDILDANTEQIAINTFQSNLSVKSND